MEKDLQRDRGARARFLSPPPPTGPGPTTFWTRTSRRLRKSGRWALDTDQPAASSFHSHHERRTSTSSSARRSTSSASENRITRAVSVSPSKAGWSPGIWAPVWKSRLTNFFAGLKLKMFPW